MEFREFEESFERLSMKFIFAVEDASELNNLLNEFNGLDWKNQLQNTSSVIQFIDNLPRIKISSNPNIIGKTCHLIKQLISKQKIVLPEEISNKLIDWILKCCETRSAAFEAAIEALTSLFKKNPNAALKNSKLLSSNGLLLKFITPISDQKSIALDSTPQELYKASLNCIEVILLHLHELEAEVEEDEIEELGKLLLNFAMTLKQEDFTENDFVNIMTSCLNCLKFCVQMDSEFATLHIGELLGLTKSYMMFSIPNITTQPPIKQVSSQQSLMEPVKLRPNKRGNGATTKSRKSRKSNKKKTDVNQDGQPHFDGFNNFPLPLYKTSDSDYSENEHYNREFVNRMKQSKLRLSALALLLVISTTSDKKTLFGFWHCLFSTEETSSPNLLNCVLKDSSPRSKILALQTIIQLLKGSKQFLIQAENKDKAPTPFTPFSVTLGNLITFAYEKLSQALIKEGDPTVLTQILKCISIFIPATPFSRLQPIAGMFFKFVRQLTSNRDPTIRVAALSVMESLITSEITSEIYELLEIPKSKLDFSYKKLDESMKSLEFNRKGEEEVEEYGDEDEIETEGEQQPEDTSALKMSWLLQTIIENLGVFNGNLKEPSPAKSVRIESLQVLCAMTSHFLLLKDHLEPISIVIEKSLKSNADEQLYACRAIDFLGTSINVYLSQDKQNLQDLDVALNFWLKLLPTLSDLLTTPENKAVRASGADGLATIGFHVFEKLDHPNQIHLLSVLTGCSFDADITIASAAIRALAIFVLFPSLRDDLCFVENTVESILRIIKDPNIAVRSKASWSLGNAVDALIMTQETQSISDRLFKEMFETSLEATADNAVTVKVNAVRTVGNLLSLMKHEQLKEPTWLDIFERSVKALHNQLLKCSNVKVKWNVCYSFTTLLKNPVFFDSNIKFKWQDLLFSSLCNVIGSSPNFKVRINACVSFTIPTRHNFAENFIRIWICLLNALEQSNNLTDFNEYKHRDTLQAQIYSSCTHMISIATAEDVVQMKNELFPLIDKTKQEWNRVFSRTSPEIQGKLFVAIASLKSLTCKSTEQKNSVEILISCFEPLY